MRIRIFLLAVAMLGLASCAQSQDCFSKDIFCAALVTDTRGLDDHGLNQETWKGLQESQSSGLADRVEYIESVDTRDYQKNISYFATRGFDVIFTVNPGMDDETLRSADLYAGSVFVGISQPQREMRSNLISVTFAEDQMGFLAGVLAARISRTRVVGAACDTDEIDSMWRYCEGFRAGVSFADESMKAFVFYRSNENSEELFIDDVWGYETGQDLIRRGADVVFAAGGGTGDGTLRAALDEQVYAIGAERDQGAAGLGVVSSVYGRASFEVQNVMRMLKAGSAVGQESGQFMYVPLSDKFSPNLGQELDGLLLKLLSGEVKTGVPFQKP